MAGAARHNLANALAAIAGAAALGLPVPAMAEALRSFGADEADNPGRGVYARSAASRSWSTSPTTRTAWPPSPALVATIPAARRLVLLGQAGDRTDAEIRALAAAVWAMRPDRIVIKEMESYLRGREPGEIPALLGPSWPGSARRPDAIAVEDSETAAVRSAFAWAQRRATCWSCSAMRRGRGRWRSSTSWPPLLGAAATRCRRADAVTAASACAVLPPAHSRSRVPR